MPQRGRNGQFKKGGSKRRRRNPSQALMVNPSRKRRSVKVWRHRRRNPDGPAGLNRGGVALGAAAYRIGSTLHRRLFLSGAKDAASLTEKKNAWPVVFFALQAILPGGRVTLELDDGRKCTLTPVDATDWFNPERGFYVEPKGTIVRGDSLFAAMELGWRETADSMTLVFRFLRKIHARARAIAGPWKIAQIAYGSAAEGTAEFSLFLMLISANLAVINFLPIPVLDGGHIVFLAYEGITRRPPNERVQVGLSYVGLLLILALMVWACGLDFGLISRK